MARNPRRDLHSPEMERALVACALADGGVYDMVGIRPDDFHRPVHARVWRAIGELRAAGQQQRGHEQDAGDRTVL